MIPKAGLSDGRRDSARRVSAKIDGYDYYATFANTVSFDTVRLALSYAAEHDLNLHTVDVRTAYLNARLEDGIEIWMRQPRGYEKTDADGKPLVCKLVKALYGLKQGARRWEATLREGLIKLGFKCSHTDAGLFTMTHGGERIILLVYVDDIILIDNSESLRKKVLEGIQAKWETTDITALEWCLGIRIASDRPNRRVYMSQSLYIKDTAKKFFPQGLKVGVRPTTPCADDITKLEKGAPDSDETCEIIDSYRSLIGALLWVANVSRPDVAYAVSTLSRFTSCPTPAHMKAALRVLTYLYKTSDYQLVLGKLTGRPLCGGDVTAPNTLVSFTDSSWGDEKPASGYACYHKGALISWASKRLKTTPLSSCESEYMAATNAAVMVIFIKDLLSDIDPQHAPDMTKLYCDNSATCQLSEDAMSGKKVKHAMRKLVYLRELRDEKLLCLRFVSGENNMADIFTKPLGGERFKMLCQQLLHTEAQQVTKESEADDGSEKSSDA